MVSPRRYLRPWLSRPAYAICWWIIWRRVHSTPLILDYHHRSYQWTLPMKKGKARTASEHFPKWIWVSRKLPARNFVLARANKGTTMARSHVNELPSLMNFRLAFSANVYNPGITPIHARTLGWTSPVHKGKVPKHVRVIRTRSQICKESEISIISWVVFLVENIYLFDLPSIVGLWTTHCGPLIVMFMPLDAQSYPC
jgi:hypothetical protein